MKTIESYFNKLITFYYPIGVTFDEINQEKSHRLFILFLLVTQMMLAIFILINISVNRDISASFDGIVLVCLAALSYYYKISGRLKSSFYGYLALLIILTSFMHLIAPSSLYSNVLWFPVILFLAYFVLPFYAANTLLAIGLISYTLAYTIPYFLPSFPQEVSPPHEILITNLALLFFSALSTAIISKVSSNEEHRVQNFLKNQKEYFENLNQNNAALTSMISHDIANPLMIAMANLNKIDSKDPALLKIRTHLKTIESIIKNARELRAIKSGKLKIELQTTHLYSVCQLAINNLESTASKKGVTFDFSCEQEDQCYIKAETNSLHSSVINNFLTNAIKFSPTGGFISLNIRTIDQQVILTISDQGIGIPAQIINNIFDFSTQTTRKGTSGEAGTGLGLPLAKIFLNMFHATVEIKSSITPPTGTSFIIKFPKIIVEDN